jgi:hypothetical protein
MVHFSNATRQNAAVEAVALHFIRTVGELNAVEIRSVLSQLLLPSEMSLPFTVGTLHSIKP